MSFIPPFACHSDLEGQPNHDPLQVKRPPPTCSRAHLAREAEEGCGCELASGVMIPSLLFLG